MLTDSEEMGIRLIVMARTGQLKMFNCSQCSYELQEMRNCTGEDGERPVWFNPIMGQFFCCPLRMISDEVKKWVDEYDYYTKYPSAYNIKYEECNPKWWDCVKLYDLLMSEFELEQHERQLASIKSK